MRQKKSLSKLLLLAGMSLAVLTCGFTALNTLLSPWPLYGRNRALLIPLTALCAACLILLMRLSDKHHAFFAAHERAFLAGAALFYFLCQTALSAALRYTPYTDVEQCVTAAKLLCDTGSIAQHERAFVYFTRNPHNLGIVYLFAGIFKFFGAFGWNDRFMQLIVVSSLLFVPGLLAGAAVCRRIGGTRAEARMLILFGSCLPLLYCSAELYTDVFALSFSAMIVYCAFRARESERRGRRALWLAALALAAFAGAEIRYPCVVTAIACLIWLALDGRLPLAALGAGLLAAVMLAGGAVVGRANEGLLTKEAIEKYRFPKTHFIAMGLPIHEDQGYGQYGDGGWLIFSTSFDDPAERDAALLQEIKDRVYYLRYPNRLLNLLSRKNLSTFGDGTFDFGDTIAADEREADTLIKRIIFPEGSLYGAYYHLCTALFAAQTLLAAAACLLAVKRGDTRGAALFVTLVGAFLFLSIWETKGRYFFQFMEILLMAAATFDGEWGKEKGV